MTKGEQHAVRPFCFCCADSASQQICLQLAAELIEQLVARLVAGPLAGGDLLQCLAGHLQRQAHPEVILHATLMLLPQAVEIELDPIGGALAALIDVALGADP